MEAKLAAAVLTLKMGDTGRKIGNEDDKETDEQEVVVDNVLEETPEETQEETQEVTPEETQEAMVEDPEEEPRLIGDQHRSRLHPKDHLEVGHPSNRLLVDQRKKTRNRRLRGSRRLMSSSSHSIRLLCSSLGSEGIRGTRTVRVQP